MVVQITRMSRWFICAVGLLGTWAWVNSGAALPLSSPDRIHVPSGWFELGISESAVAASMALCRDHGGAGQVCDAARFQHEGPPRRVFVGAYRIDLREVSIADHRRCEFALRCAPPRGKGPTGRDVGSLPVTGVTYQDAQAYCAFAGGRLPTEPEWERAARGAGGRLFPWGALWNPELARHAGNGVGPASVTAYPAGKSARGLLNMAGNVWEITSGSAPGAKSGKLQQGQEQGRLIRGGSYTSGPVELRSTARAVLPPAGWRRDVGFRCVYER